MELLLLIILAILLVSSTFFHISVIYGLFLWLLMVLLYGFCHGCTLHTLFPVLIWKISSVSGVLITFALIGMLSAVLRSCGSISLVISFCHHLTLGKLVLPASFFLCSFMSFCTGSAFATVASIGLICASVGHMADIPNALLYGAILSGIYVGDRISPVSSSAALVSDIAGYNLYDNIHSMFNRFSVPFFISLLLYALLGLFYGSSHIQTAISVQTVSWISILPVLLILLFSYLKCNSKLTLICAIGSGFLITALRSPFSVRAGFTLLFSGYHDSDAALSMLNGGGILSMLRPMLIILIATCYVAVFELTGFLKPLQNILRNLTFSDMGKGILVSVLSSILAGSQTLAVILSSLLLKEETDHKKLADTLEDTSILIPAMIPWSTAFSVPAAALSASALCIPFAFYLYLVPLYAWFRDSRPLCSFSQFFAHSNTRI